MRWCQLPPPRPISGFISGIRSKRSLHLKLRYLPVCSKLCPYIYTTFSQQKMISEIIILSARGEPLVHKECILIIKFTMDYDQNVISGLKMQSHTDISGSSRGCRSISLDMISIDIPIISFLQIQSLIFSKSDNETCPKFFLK